MSNSQGRRGLVLGSGGVLGFAWTIGALGALEEFLNVDCRSFDMIVGTSAGSIAASVLGCHVSVAAMRRHQLGIPEQGDPTFEYHDELNGGRSRPLRPKPGIGSTKLLWATARNPRQFSRAAAVSSILPLGRASLDPLRTVIRTILPAESTWTPHPAVWVVAMDYDNGKRIAFGHPDAPPAQLADAVAASCAIPAWFTPVVIGDRRYVDGGMYSVTSADLMVDQGLDEIYVIAPMVSFATVRLRGMLARAERSWRQANARRLRREAAAVMKGGTRVTIVCPGPEDLLAMGPNMMDVSRRVSAVEIGRQTATQMLRDQRGTFAY